MTQRPPVSDLVNERLARLDQQVMELRRAEESAALGAVELINDLQTANIAALLDIVRLLSTEIDQLRADAQPN